jgi:hypothetical protein
LSASRRRAIRASLGTLRLGTAGPQTVPASNRTFTGCPIVEPAVSSTHPSAKTKGPSRGPLFWRRGRDSNPRYGFHRTHAFQACDLNHSSTSPVVRILTKCRNQHVRRVRQGDVRGTSPWTLDRFEIRRSRAGLGRGMRGSRLQRETRTLKPLIHLSGGGDSTTGECVIFPEV